MIFAKIVSLKQQVKGVLIDLLENHDSAVGKAMGYSLVMLVLMATGAFMLETTTLGTQYTSFFRAFDVFVLTVFSLEYVARVFIATRRFQFVFSLVGLLDLVVIFAYGATFGAAGMLRMFRVLRILQMLKVIEYSDVMVSFFRSFKNYANELKILAIATGTVLLLSSGAMYYLEGGINAGILNAFDALWWAMVTASTVGYGDVVPVTAAGKVLAMGVLVMGLVTIAILTAIITRIFIDHFFGKRMHECHFCHYPHHDWDSKFCKNCGGALDIDELATAKNVTLTVYQAEERENRKREKEKVTQ